MKRLHILILAMLIVSCSEKENPYRMEMDGLLHENKLLNDAIIEAKNDQAQSAAFASLLQSMNEKLEADSKRLRGQVEELSAKNDDLSVQLGVLTERERESNSKIRASEAKKEEAEIQKDLKRAQTMAAITAANQSKQIPFRVFDEMFVGKKELNGRLQDAGRLSIRNYTDQTLTVMIQGLLHNKYIKIPPNSSSNSIYVTARKGEKISIRGAGHTETILW